MTGSTYVMGDVHGHLDRLRTLLISEGLIDDRDAWTGGDAELWFIGDFTDRGPQGIATLDLVMKLEKESEAAGGQVAAVLGNHDVWIVAAHRFGRREGSDRPGPFMLEWMMNGGRTADLEQLQPRHIEWLTTLPAAALSGTTLLVHADTDAYLDHGDSVEEINRSFADALGSEDIDGWDVAVSDLTRRMDFVGDTSEALDRMLEMAGAERLVHGHTPIPLVTESDPQDVTEPFEYADGRCVNVDGGMFLGGPGFLYLLEA